MKFYRGLLFSIMIMGSPVALYATSTETANDNFAPMASETKAKLSGIIKTIESLEIVTDEAVADTEESLPKRRSFGEWMNDFLPKIPALSSKTRRKLRGQTTLEQRQQDMAKGDIKRFHEGLADRLLRDIDPHPRTFESVMELFNQNPNIAEQINSVIDQAGFKYGRPVHPLIAKLIDILVFEAALHTPYPQAIELHYTGRYPTDDPRFVTTYAKFIKGHARSIDFVNRYEDPVSYFAVAEWIQFFLSLTNPTPEAIQLISKIPMSYWTTQPTDVRRRQYETHWADREISGNVRLKVWRQFYPVDPSALNLVIEELGAVDRSLGPELVYEFLGRHRKSLTSEQRQRIISKIISEQHLEAMKVHLPELFDELSRAVPDDINGLVRFILQAQPSPKLFYAMTLLHERALAASRHATAPTPLGIDAKNLTLLEDSLVRRVREFLSVSKTSERRLLLDGLATHSLLLAYVLRLEESRFDFIPVVMRSASKEFLDQHRALVKRLAAKARAEKPRRPRADLLPMSDGPREMPDGVTELVIPTRRNQQTPALTSPVSEENKVVPIRSSSCRKAFR